MNDPRAMALEFLAELKQLFGGRLHAATLFGSAARGEWIEGLSDVNVLVLMDDIHARAIGDAAPAARRALSNGVRPLLMELDEWGRASDVFAIEVADMKDAHEVLLGMDPTASAAPPPSSLRLQAEREMRAKLIHLHAGMLLSADDRARLGELLVRSLPSFTTYLRAALRLAGHPVPRTSSDVIAKGCALVGTDPSAFLAVLEARGAGGHLELSLQDPVADRFNTAAERIAAFTDAFGEMMQ
jgi:predicted nucleotidyltransferase